MRASPLRLRHAPRIAFLLLALGLVTLLAAPALAFSNRTLFSPVGEARLDLFGSKASSGDLNGDGYADVIVAAPDNGAGGVEAGRVYVYLGGPRADAVADLVLTGAAAYDEFGISVAFVGDVNGDGYDDFMVGASGNDAGGAEAGRAYLYLGGPAPDATADLTLTGEAGSDFFGTAVGGIGDVNGDGYDDFAVGAPYSDWVYSNGGKVYFYLGGRTLDGLADLAASGSAASDAFGSSVGRAGDVNGDGYDDAIVGAPNNDAAGSNAGRAYVYYGGRTVESGADLILTGVAAGDLFGNAVDAAGDMNGDGYDDVLVTAYGNDGAGADAGRVYVFYGSTAPDATADLTLSGAAAGDQFGGAAAGAGDVNGDGYADLVVGAKYNDTNGTSCGRAYVFFGGVSPDATADFTITGDRGLVEMGSSVAGVGDVDGDGLSDLVIGALGDSTTAYYAGRAHVVSLFPYKVLLPNGGEVWAGGGPATVRWLGHDPADIAVSVNGGLSWSTLAVGVGGLDENEYRLTAPSVASDAALVRLTYTGQTVKHSTSDVSDAVFRIVTPAAPPAAADRLALTFAGSTTNANLGNSVAGAGDVNGDGYADAIIGVPNIGTTSAGHAYLYFGGPAADAIPDVTPMGFTVDDRFGVSVGTAGDVNGDGYDDFIVGAHFDDVGGTSAGRAYVYFGGPSPDASADIAPYGAAASDYFGFAVGTAGDVNGDGYADFVVGAYGNDYGGTNAGRAYVYFGGPVADGVADWVLTGPAVGDYFGYAVGTAGDVNGDGYDDVVVGAYLNDAGGSNAGRAYLFFGGAAPDSVADLVMTGSPAGDNFASSVAAAGDLNGDGYGDWLVGAPGTGAGRAQVYLGGPVPDAMPDLVLSEGASGDDFGYAVAGAGDLNGDGYGDFLVGADYNDGAGTNAGRTYVYFGGVPLDGTPDMLVSGAAGDFAGDALGAVGDFFGDGFGDFMVGAGSSDVGGTNYGRAYLYDCNRYFVLSPNDGETWNVGSTATVSWLGAQPADLWLSADGGATWQELKRGVGGAATNAVPVQVPHLPTHFARVKVAPSDASVSGEDRSDSLFTIQSSVALLAFSATLGESGAELEWSTEPAVSPEGLAGYRIYRLATGSTGNGTRVGPELITATRYTDAGGQAGMTYRLVAVNGLMQELELGRVSLAPAAPLAAWPLPYRGGALNVSFAVYGMLGAAGGEANVALYDLSGRQVRVLASGPQAAGSRILTWDGTDAHGQPVSEGVYFLQARSAGVQHQVKVVVLR